MIRFSCENRKSSRPRDPLRRKSTWIILGVVAVGLFVLLAGAATFLCLFFGLLVSPRPNAICPRCQRTCHIRGLEELDPDQKEATPQICPHCGVRGNALAFDHLNR